MSFASRLHSVCTPITLDAYRICSSPRQSFLQPSRRRPGVFHSSEFSAVPRPFLWNILRWANARNPIMYHSGQCGEFSSQKVAAILGSRLSERSGRACRVCAYTSIALHAARPHSTQALSRSEAGLPCFCEVRSADTQIRHTVACRPIAFVRREMPRQRLTRSIRSILDFVLNLCTKKRASFSESF